MRRFFHRRTTFAVIAFGVLAAPSCSLFVSLDGLSDAPASSDASTIDGGGDAQLASDSATVADVHLDAPPCVPLLRVQSAHATDGDDGGLADTLSVALTDTELANDFLVVGINYFDCGSISDVTDNVGNTYQSLIPAAGSGTDGRGVLETWGASNVRRATSNVITVHFATACSGRNLKVVEYSGIDAFTPVFSTASQLAAPDAAAEAGLTASGAAVLFAHTADERTCMGPGNGWTAVFIDGWATIAEELMAPEGGTFIASEQPSSTDNWGIQAVSFRACQSP